MSVVLAALLKAGGWLLKNPAWALCIGLGIFAGLQTWRLHDAQTDLATEKLAFVEFKRDLAEQTAAAERANAERSRTQAQRLADDFMTIQATASDVKVALDAAKSSGACERDPKWRATVDGVRRIGAQGNSGPAPGKAD